LAFITPAWQRYALTDICLRQRAWVCGQLRRRYGVDATCVVVADDANLDIARKHGFAVVSCNNRSLADRFNAGYRWAAGEGIECVFPIGSDSWIDPNYFADLPKPGELLLSRSYALVRADGKARCQFWITWDGGVQWITHTADWRHRDYKAAQPGLHRGCDTSTWLRRLKGITIREHHGHPLEYVAFQSAENQISSYQKMKAQWGIGEVEGRAVFGDLAGVYRPADVKRIRAHYKADRRK
jgi:hypothetical protein